MVEKFNFKRYKKIHFIGINGISMSALAKYCFSQGKTVTGSDTDGSDENGVKSVATVYVGHCAENVHGADLVVYTSAISETNPELTEALKLGITTVKRSELLGNIARGYKNTVAVSGSHGKTTATAMLSHIFYEADLSPVAFVGGNDTVFGNFLSGKGNYLITEACEYKKNFLDIEPTVAVVLNIDDDHLDSYGNMENMIETFKKFVSHSVAVINADDPNSKNLGHYQTLSFGIKNNARYMAKNLRKTPLGYSFTLFVAGIKRMRINLKTVGIHNVYNALSAIAVADYFGIEERIIKRALEKFTSVSRRAENLGRIKGVKVTADYAHHPKELSAALSVLTDDVKNALVVFQPHTYSRTRLLMNEFTDVLKTVGKVIIYKTFSAREEYDEEGSAYTLYNNLKKVSEGEVIYASTPAELKDLLYENCEKTSDILVLGAGDVYYLVKKMLS